MLKFVNLREQEGFCVMQVNTRKLNIWGEKGPTVLVLDLVCVLSKIGGMLGAAGLSRAGTLRIFSLHFNRARVSLELDWDNLWQALALLRQLFRFTPECDCCVFTCPNKWHRGWIAAYVKAETLPNQRGEKRKEKSTGEIILVPGLSLPVPPSE